MKVNYNIQKINHALQDFYNATGINMDLLKNDFSFVNNDRYWGEKRYCKAIQSTKEGKKACIHSDKSLFEKSKNSKKTEMHICHAGLIDVSVPVLYNDEIIGYIIFGQMKINDDFPALKNYITKLGLDQSEMEQYYSEIECYETDKIKSISNIAQMLVKHILLESISNSSFDDSFEKVLSYINENIDKNITIQTLSKNVNLSKSVLYRRFKTNFNSTVNQYINRQRIEKSIELLTKTNLSIEEISQRVGFTSGSYFSKIFKKEKGVSPFKFKKSAV